MPECVALQLVVTNLRGAVVRPASFSVEAGRCAAINGPSGSGKSLLLRMIADLEPNEGQVYLGEVERDKIPAPEWRRQVIYVPTEAGWWAEEAAAHLEPRHGLSGWLDWRRFAETVGVTLSLWAGGNAGPEIRASSADVRPRAEDLSRRLGLEPDLLDRDLSTLSTGERQRLAIIRAILRTPKVLLLDEPTSALDPTSIARVESVLQEEMARGMILVLVSHDDSQAERIGGKRYEMDDGRLRPVG